jgi:hypothetical protein
MRSKYSEFFNGTNGYIQAKKEVLEGISMLRILT